MTKFPPNKLPRIFLVLYTLEKCGLVGSDMTSVGSDLTMERSDRNSSNKVVLRWFLDLVKSTY